MAEHKNMKEYHGQIQEALDDKFLRKTLDKFAVDYKANRARIFEGWNVPELVSEVAEIKDNAAQHMMELFEQFKAEAEKRGVHVHLASTGAEANRIIARIAKDCGARVMMQSEELSGDFKTSDSAVINVLYQLQENGEELPETTVLLHCSSPLTLAQDIDGTVRLVSSGKCDSALSVTPVYKYFWKQDATTGEVVEDGHDRRIRQVRQERSPKYLETGAVYAMNTQGFLENKTRLFGHTDFYEMPFERFCDIDTQADLTVAEILIAAQIQNGLR